MVGVGVVGVGVVGVGVVVRGAGSGVGWGGWGGWWCRGWVWGGGGAGSGAWGILGGGGGVETAFGKAKPLIVLVQFMFGLFIQEPLVNFR